MWHVAVEIYDPEGYTFYNSLHKFNNKQIAESCANLYARSNLDCKVVIVGDNLFDRIVVKDFK